MNYSAVMQAGCGGGMWSHTGAREEISQCFTQHVPMKWLRTDVSDSWQGQTSLRTSLLAVLGTQWYTKRRDL